MLNKNRRFWFFLKDVYFEFSKVAKFESLIISTIQVKKSIIENNIYNQTSNYHNSFKTPSKFDLTIPKKYCLTTTSNAVNISKAIKVQKATVNKKSNHGFPEVIRS